MDIHWLFWIARKLAQVCFRSLRNSAVWKCVVHLPYTYFAVSAKKIASAHSLVITNCDKEADCLVISNTLSIWPFILAFTRMPCPYFRTIGIRALPPPPCTCVAVIRTASNNFYTFFPAKGRRLAGWVQLLQHLPVLPSLSGGGRR